MNTNDITVEIRDKNLTRLGVIPVEYLDLSLSLKHNDISTFTLTLPLEFRLTQKAMNLGAGIVVSIKGNTVFSGIITKQVQMASATDDLGTLELSGISDMFILLDKAAWADPLHDIDMQVNDHDTQEGSAEAVIKHYVEYNAGNKALSHRQDIYNQRLLLSPYMNFGNQVAISVRYDPLLDVCKEIAKAGNITFDVLQTGSNLLFSIYENEDRSKRIRLDVNNNLLSSAEVSKSTPSLTRVYEMGQGEGVERYIELFQTDNAIESEQAFGRKIELFKDQRNVSNDDAAAREKELKTASDEEFLDKDKEQVQAVATPNENSSIKLFDDYNLGDIVAIVYADKEYKAQITGVAISINSNGYNESFSIGDMYTLDETAKLIDIINKQNRQIINLERSL
jgi:hypothetical protein